ncbi:hypothetical protein SAMN05421504_11024 [Amycolatopsis xylanica]|uniref:Uncharacterized protein n=1 Tax=Amycolatopsis xylanica TaxID=589385 RepID=A0A1H3QQN6_9PSEU|nr:hypothetical protein SAMN05421504_11024 [Amycolatopsis xylanica]
MLVRVLRLIAVTALAIGLSVSATGSANAAPAMRPTGPAKISKTAAQPSVFGKYHFKTTWKLEGDAYCLEDCVLVVTWRDGHEEWFVSGSDAQMYRAVRGAGSWTKMGGCATHILDAYYYHDQYPTVEVQGCDSPPRRWCSSWTGSSWQKWHLCASDTFAARSRS